MAEAQPIRIGMIGCGTIGSGVVNVLLDNREQIARRLGRPLELARVLDKPGADRSQIDRLDPALVTTDHEAFFAEPDMPIVVELAGGKGVISQRVRQALESGRHVVTANKSLLAAEGPELFALARRHGVSIGFEASCGGGIPFITALTCGLMANRVQGLYGILNGTCNYILTEMIRADKTYQTALSEAQEKGFAEADPTLDVGGGDTAQKLAVLASLAFGVCITGDQVPCTGIDTLDLADVRFGAELGYDIKLLGIAERAGADDPITLSVQPCFVHRDEPLAQVAGSFNAVSVYGNAVGHTLHYGRGAGSMPTASAVVSDVMNIAGGWYPKLFSDMTLWADQNPPAVLMDRQALTSRWYVRLEARDAPGTLAAITEALGQAGISISAVLQHEVAAGSFVPVVITTHTARNGDLAQALEQIARLDVVRGPSVCVRIVDFPAG